jgi:predicted Zn-dependent protease
MSKKIGMLVTSAIVLLIFLLNLGGHGRAIASEYSSNFERIPAVDERPPQVAIWKRTPTIIVCEYAPINKDAIKKAVKFWEALGYNFFTTQYKYDPLDKCKSKAPIGYILIHLVTQGIKLGDDSLAETHFYVDNDHNEIEWAIIYMRSETRETVLEHEIGHALGFLHFNRINHLMNSKWTQGGWDKSGLQNKQR